MTRLLLALLLWPTAASLFACQLLPDSHAGVEASAFVFTESQVVPADFSDESHGFSCPPSERACMSYLARSKRGDWLSKKRVQVYGWTEVAFTASTAQATQLPMGFNYRANDFLLQQNWLRVERPVEEGASWGFLADTILPGSDYRFTRIRGLWDSQSGSLGIDPVQFFAQVNLPEVAQGMNLKLGRFFGQYGVESIAAVDTPFLSRAYNFIYNPFTHTGLLATVQIADAWTVQSGIVTGSDVFFDSAASPTYIGSFKFEGPGAAGSLLFSTILGPGEFDQKESFSNPRIFDLVYSRRLSERVNFKLDSLFGYEENVPSIGTANWFAFVNYLSFDFSEQLQGNLRFEFFDDVDGYRTGSKGLYSAVTTGLSIRPSRRLIFRPEVRYDKNDSTAPFAGRSDLVTAALDLIVLW